jgi:single-stranded DNA-specific DHH superfamily exonuclease
MGRSGNKNTKLSSAKSRSRTNPNFQKTLTLNDVFDSLETGADIGPNWTEVASFYVHEAQQFNPAMAFGYLRTIPEVGDKTAQIIIDELGDDCIQKIDQDPEILRPLAEKYPALSNQAFDTLITNWEDIRDRRGALVHLDQTVALALSSKEFPGNFQNHRRWYLGSPSLIVKPGDTCPGMDAAGESLAKHIDNGDKIAVFCDYDVDGTTAGEVFRRGVSPYLKNKNQLLYQYADAASGFGLTNEFVEEAAKKGCKVLVTLDCGSGQGDQVALAQKLGMEVVVVDHHGVGDNPADFHLNPKLEDPPTSDNTGSQLSWKLAASVQVAKEGKTRPEHWQENLKLAATGCFADAGPVSLPENRAFFWTAAENVPAGIQALADVVNENGGSEHPEIPGEMIQTQAILNLPKRTTLVKGEEIADLLSEDNEKEAKKKAKKLFKFYNETARPVKDQMIEEAISNTPEGKDVNGVALPQLKDDRRIAHYVINDRSEYSGNSGLIASKLSRHAAVPAIVFNKTESVDADGNPLYKFSSRNESRVNHQLGEMLKNKDLKDACQIEVLNQNGEKESAAKFGGHPEVVSGTCSKENINKVVDAFEDWAQKKGSIFFPRPYNGPEAKLVERQVNPERLSIIEEQSKRFAPFSNRFQIIEPRAKNRQAKEDKNTPPVISVIGTLKDLKPDPENDKYLSGQLVLENGDKREVRYPADEKAPKNKSEWVLRSVGRPGPYYLRTHHKNPKPLTNRIVSKESSTGQEEELQRSKKEQSDWSGIEDRAKDTYNHLTGK